MLHALVPSQYLTPDDVWLQLPNPETRGPVGVPIFPSAPALLAPATRPGQNLQPACPHRNAHAETRPRAREPATWFLRVAVLTESRAGEKVPSAGLLHLEKLKVTQTSLELTGQPGYPTVQQWGVGCKGIDGGCSGALLFL